jgi:hypothetical protein
MKLANIARQKGLVKDMARITHFHKSKFFTECLYNYLALTVAKFPLFPKKQKVCTNKHGRFTGLGRTSTNMAAKVQV